MRRHIFFILSLGATSALAEEVSCPEMTVFTAPAIKAYRAAGIGCTPIHSGKVTLRQGIKRLRFHSITNCRPFPTLPPFCDLDPLQLWQADHDGDCKVNVEWNVNHDFGTECTATDH